MMKKLLFIFILLNGIFSVSAQSINQYKYVLIPETFEFTGEVNQYQLNSLAKFLFEKEGFHTLMLTDKKPLDLLNDPCNALNFNIENNSGLFTTRFTIVLKNCNNEVVFRSEEGVSKEKEYGKAYHEAFRRAFESVRELNYAYKTGEKMDRNNMVHTNPEADVEPEKEIVEISEPTTKEEQIPENTLSKNKSEDAEKDITIRQNELSEKGKVFSYAENIYELQKTEFGFELFQDGVMEPVGLLINSDQAGIYHYKSLTRTGLAYFDGQENMIIEYLGGGGNQKIVQKYVLKDQ